MYNHSLFEKKLYEKFLALENVHFQHNFLQCPLFINHNIVNIMLMALSHGVKSSLKNSLKKSHEKNPNFGSMFFKIT